MNNRIGVYKEEPRLSADASNLDKISAVLRDVIVATPGDPSDEIDPQKAFEDLGVRFVLRLAHAGFTVVPSASKSIPLERERQNEIEFGLAAKRTLGILTEWLAWNEDRHITLARQSDQSDGPRFGVTAGDEIRRNTAGYFKGESLQDALAQMASTLTFNGGKL